MRPFQYVIIGAGFAGAATAYHLSHRGVKDILILEQEKVAGFHSSGRNASMVRQVVSEPAVAALAREGAEFLRQLPADWPIPVAFQQNGSLLLGKGVGWKKLCRDAEMAQKVGIEVERWSSGKAMRHVKVLANADFDGAVWCPTDGVVDIHALLSGYIKAAAALGTQIRYGLSVRGIDIQEGRVRGVLTSEGLIRTETVINAAGAWAMTIGKLAGAAELPLVPCRRHLFVTGPLAWAEQGWPFVWDITNDLYFRPESGGLLMCPCDQAEMAPGDPPTDGSVLELLAEKVKQHLPGFPSVPVKKWWAGLRTLSPDNRFAIGWDPSVRGLFWVAGLGGHGVTTSSSVGALAACLILDPAGSREEPFSVTRFVS
ncbi:MAG: NAD(P)/FAD-dependent oxidoreductase [Candidatus Binatia bacterium]